MVGKQKGKEPLLRAWRRKKSGQTIASRRAALTPLEEDTIFEEILPDEWSKVFTRIVAADRTKVEADVAKLKAAWDESHDEARAIFLGEVAGAVEIWARPLRLAA